MSEQDNVQLIKDIYAAFSRGDIPTILDSLSDDAQMRHSGVPGTLPWAGRTLEGKEQWAQFFTDLGATFDPEAFEPEEYLAQGDRVVALGHFGFRVKANGNSYESPWAMAWTVRDGKAADCRVYEDTESQANALRAA